MKRGNTLMENDRKYSIFKIPRAAGCWHFILYPEANYVLYHILRAWEAAGGTLPSLNTDFRTGQCRYFFQDGMNLPIELRLGLPHALVESSDAQKSLCSYVSLVIHCSLSRGVKCAEHQSYKDTNYCTTVMLKWFLWCICVEMLKRNWMYNVKILISYLSEGQ